MRKTWDIHGGVHPADNKTQSVTGPISSLPLPARLVLPLGQHAGNAAKPLVGPGDTVLKGQLLAEPQGFVSAAVHAPTSGVIDSIGDHQVPHPSGMSAPCIVLIPDGQDQWLPHQGIEDYRSTTPQALLDHIRHAGIVGLGGAGFPSAVKLAPRQPVHTLIINGTECEPYITADDMLMRERATDIVEGIRILRYLLNEPETVLIGVEDNKPEAIAALTSAVAGTDIEVVTFPTKYPSGGEKQIIQILTGLEVPSGKLPADLGVLCQNVGTTYAVYRAVCFGEPLISRITTVTGDACSSRGNVEVLLGTPISDLLAAHGFQADNCSKLIMGGPMMGFELPDPNVPVIKTTNCIIAASQAEAPPAPPAQPCIRCGMCAEACPATLLPQQLLWYSQAQDHDRLEAHNLFDCIECGACDYVCPSNIPLVQYYRAAKGEIRKLEAERKKSDHARQRYEFHKARLERAEAEKAAKREARRKAAEQAQRKSAEQSAGDSPAKGSADDIIQAAMARAAARQASPEQQKAKLERGLEAARNRLAVATDKLQEARDGEASDEQVTKLQVKVDEARRKLDEAQRKLAEFETPPADTDPNARIANKIQASRQSQVESKIATLKDKIAVTERKVAEADDDKQRTALEAGLGKLQAKLSEAEKELAELPADANQPVQDEPAMDAAAAAIARARQRAKEQAGQTPAQKLESSLTSLRTRIDKARSKLEAAEAEQSEHIDTLRSALEKLEQKQRETEQQLQQLSQETQS